MYYIYIYIYTYSIYTYNYMHSCLIFVGANNLVNTMSFFPLAVLNFPRCGFASVFQDNQKDHRNLREDDGKMYMQYVYIWGFP